MKARSTDFSVPVGIAGFRHCCSRRLHRHFAALVDAYHQAWREYFVPLIFKRALADRELRRQLGPRTAGLLEAHYQTHHASRGLAVVDRRGSAIRWALGAACAASARPRR